MAEGGLVTFVDTNVVVDILRRDPHWFGWSFDRLALATEAGAVMISAVVVAELSWTFDMLDDLTGKLNRMSMSTQSLTPGAAFVAGKRFQSFRRTRRDEDHPRVLPDFLIGAQALVDNAALLTRDPRLYLRYFPDLTLITPETQP
jgi:predicted nucleic acid-binding protein